MKGAKGAFPGPPRESQAPPNPRSRRPGLSSQPLLPSSSPLPGDSGSEYLGSVERSCSRLPGAGGQGTGGLPAAGKRGLRGEGGGRQPCSTCRRGAARSLSAAPGSGVGAGRARSGPRPLLPAPSGAAGLCLPPAPGARGDGGELPASLSYLPVVPIPLTCHRCPFS